MTDLQKFGIGLGTLFAIFVAGLIATNISYDRGYRACDAVYRDSLSSARHTITTTTDTSTKPVPKQSVKIIYKSLPDSVQKAKADSIFAEGVKAGQATLQKQFEDATQPIDTVAGFGKDSVHVQVYPLSHVLTIGLILAPDTTIKTTIKDSVAVALPVLPVPWYDSPRAHEVYGGGAVLVIVWLSHLIK